MFTEFTSQFKVTSWKAVILGVLAGFIVIGGFASSFYFGYLRGVAEPKTLSLQFANVEVPDGGPDAADFNIFWQTWKIIRDEALKGKEITDKEMIYGAVRGLVNSLSDPHSVFLPPEETKEFREDIQGTFSGVGMEIGKKNGDLVIITPLKDSPAEKAGLQPNDQILKINDAFTGEMDVEQAVKLIRGQQNTQVTLLIYRDGWDKAEEFKVTRDVINIPTVEFDVKEGNVGYIELSNFNEQAGTAFYRALIDVMNRGSLGLIVDLRNNPGGYLEVSVDIAGWFLPKGTLVVSEQPRDGNRREFKSDGEGQLKDTPVVILINEGSASAAEILAGALRNQMKAKLVGAKTFGKGTVQMLEGLTDGSTIKLTIANWVLPDGTIIEKNGLEPDLKVEITDEDVKARRDPQLDKALEIIMKDIKAGKTD